MDVLFPAFLELPGSDTLPVLEVNFPRPRPTLEARESPPLSERKLLDRGLGAMILNHAVLVLTKYAYTMY